MGEFEEADRTIDAIDQIRATSGLFVQEHLLNHAHRMILYGHLEEAVDVLVELNAHFHERGELQMDFSTTVLMADALGELRLFERALVVLEKTVQLGMTRPRQVSALASLSRIASHTGHHRRAQQAYTQALEIAGQEMYAWEQGFLSWASAHLFTVQGDWPNALKSFQESESVFNRMEDRWNQSRVLRDWAEMHVNRRHDGDVEEARSLFLRVQSMYEEMDMDFYAEKVAERLRSLNEE